jgi:hypothetical protein
VTAEIVRRALSIDPALRRPRGRKRPKGGERNPILFGSALSLGIGHAVSVVGNVAYVANDFGMVEIYDVLDKTAPALAGQLPIGGVVKDVFATDEYIYAVNGLGLVIEPAVRLHDALD